MNTLEIVTYTSIPLGATGVLLIGNACIFIKRHRNNTMADERIQLETLPRYTERYSKNLYLDFAKG
jgi:hypothetical protein